MSKTKFDVIKEVTMKIAKVNTTIRQFIQCNFKKHNIDLTFEMVQVMGILWRKDGVNQQEIANITVKDKASITYIIDNLTKRGLVTRLEDANDRRNKLILLTEHGKLLQTKVQPFINEMYEAAEKDLDITQLTDFMVFLDKMDENLKV